MFNFSAKIILNIQMRKHFVLLNYTLCFIICFLKHKMFIFAANYVTKHFQ